ncbi:MAG: class I SAM-dependent methyltransferase [Clostridium sp.]|nr:MAG: class I SAM-dependent methyltransferase [Clostridium sp.]
MIIQKNIIIADLCLHYFDLSKKQKYFFSEIYRVLKENGYLIARVNSFNDIQIPLKSKIEKALLL